MDYFGYFLSLIMLYCFISIVLRLSDYLTDIFIDPANKNKEKIKAKFQKIKIDSCKSKIKEESNNILSVKDKINELIEEGGSHYKIKKLLKIINSKSFSTVSFNSFLNGKSISDLNKLRNILKEDLKKTEPLYKNSLLIIFITAITSEIVKKGFNVQVYQPSTIKLLWWYIAGVILLIFVSSFYKKSKKILLESDYIISEIDLVIQKKLDLNTPR